MAVSTFRQTSVAALMAVLNGRVSNAPNTTQIAAAYRIRPRGDVSPTPYAYLGDWSEVITHTSGTRIRNAETSVVLATELTAVSEETLGKLDILTDTFVDDLTAAGFAVASPSILPVSVEAGEDSQEGGSVLELVVINLRSNVQEGRP